MGKTESGSVGDWAGKPHAEVKTLKAEINRLYKQLEKVKAGRGLIIEAVEDIFKDEPPVISPPARPKDTGKGTEEIAVVHISDTQIGKVTKTYNPSVCRDRLHLLVEKVAQITELRRAGSKIEECHLYLGGDIVEGEDIFPGQSHEIEGGVFEQAVRSAPAMLVETVLGLMGIFDRVNILCVRGNHGRNSRFANKRTNWDSVVYRICELMLLGPHAPPEVHNRLAMRVEDETFWVVDRLWDWGNLVVHGDQVRGGFAGLPWYGVSKKMAGWTDSIPEPWETLLFGHFHTPAQAVINHKMFLANGTTESGNEFAQEQLAAAGCPAQRLAFWNEKHGLIADHIVWLDDRTPQRQRGKEW